MNILEILKTKPHNLHYLNRYFTFIMKCREIYNPNLYTESHHICPKAKDMFPEYANIKEFQENEIRLTDRQHFIAHWLLWKIYNNMSQTHAFMCMADNQTSKNIKRKEKTLNSKTYSILKTNSRIAQSRRMEGIASYRNKEGLVIICATNDPRVTSGELVSTTLGRKHKIKDRTPEQIKDRSIKCSDARWKKNPIREARLYFLDIRIIMRYTKGMPELLPYLDQGWSLNRETKEYRTKVATLSNINRSPASRKKAGNSISATAKRKKELGIKPPRIITKEFRKSRRNKKRDYNVLCFDTKTSEFIKVDKLDISETQIQCFVRGRLIFDINDNKRSYNNSLSILPPGYFEVKSTDISLVYDFTSKQALKISTRNISKDQIKVTITNDRDRVRFIDTLTNTEVYWHKKLIKKYGVPINYSKST